MEGATRRIGRKRRYSMMLRRAAQLIFFKRHMEPGVKGWELRRKLGSDYPKVIQLLDERLRELGLTVKIVFEDGSAYENPTIEQLDKARFYVTLREELTLEDAKMIGWRIDDLAALAVTLAYIISKGGKAPRREVEDLLKVKIPEWRVEMNLNRYLKSGYIIEDEKEMLYLGWRARAEVDEKKLIDLLLGEELGS
ncbi:hypothetical protein DRO37_08930 [Candidatus Bathyarchaeota archaeon]|nr:MAG: hypothetical protein DRO37_08930 [Candidatus Bathyarchaeota archaeon]